MHGPEAVNRPVSQTDRRHFLAGLSRAAALLALQGCRFGPGLRTPSSADEALRRMDSGGLTSLELVRNALGRIAALDRRGPSLHAVIAVDPEAEAQARHQDSRRRLGSAGPLAGIPVLIKDNIDTAGRLPTTAGSLALSDVPAAADAPLVARLRAAGAVILGKSNLSEWANFRSSRSISGWSAMGGQTRNPHALARTPWGSSSGSAAAVAAAYTAVAVGTETNGSIITPASACGVVGLKPTVGLVSRTGIVPIAASQDTAGPMARSVRDAALLLEGMAGTDPEDPATAEADRHRREGYRRFLRPDALKGRRIGVARDFFGDHPEADRLIESHFGLLRQLGAEIVDPVRIPDHGKVHEGNFAVMLHEFRTGLASYLARRGDTVRVHSLAEVIAFNEAHAGRELAVFDQDTLVLAERTPPLSEAEHRRLQGRCRERARENGIVAALEAHRLDALIAPSCAPATHIDPVNRDHYIGGCTSLPAIGGTPHLTVPAGTVRGLPVGMSFLGAPWSEAELLGFGHAFESAANARPEPRFLHDVPFPEES